MPAQPVIGTTLKLMLRLAAVSAIGLYQRYVSPYKGYCCAYRAHTGRSSCSDFGSRVIGKMGVVAGIRLLFDRFAACAVAAEEIRKNEEKREGINAACPLSGKEKTRMCADGCVGACPWP